MPPRHKEKRWTLSDIENMQNPSPQKALVPEDFLSTGIVLLNLALTGHHDRGFIKGTYNHVVGVSDSGKTMMLLAVMAEASINSAFDDYDLFYADIERGVLVDVERFYGKKCNDRLVFLKFNTQQELFDHMHQVAQGDKPCIYIVDSLDALVHENTIKRFEENIEARREGKNIQESYGTEKAIANAQGLAQCGIKFENNGSILIAVSHAKLRLNDPFGGMRNAGGDALKFFATSRIWTKKKKTLTKTTKEFGTEKKLQTGIRSEFKVEKGRKDGKVWQVEVDILHGTGIDCIGSQIDRLIEYGHWKMKGAYVQATELDLKMYRNNLANKIIESPELTLQLAEISQELWSKVSNATKVRSRSKYADA